MRIGVIDSGIGGLTTIFDINYKYKGNTFYFISDSKNLPYGNKPHDILKSIIQENVKKLLYFDIDLLLIACNTASTLMLDELKKEFNIPVVGVFPSIDNIINKNEKTLLLATKNTINKIQDKIKNANGIIDCVIMLDLAEKIEKTAPNFDSLISILNNLNIENYHNIILGCTHYVFLKPLIKEKFPNIIILNGNDQALDNIKKYKLIRKKFPKKGTLFFCDTSQNIDNLKKIQCLCKGKIKLKFHNI